MISYRISSNLRSKLSLELSWADGTISSVIPLSSMLSLYSCLPPENATKEKEGKAEKKASSGEYILEDVVIHNKESTTRRTPTAVARRPYCKMTYVIMQSQRIIDHA